MRDSQNLHVLECCADNRQESEIKNPLRTVTFLTQSGHMRIKIDMIELPVGEIIATRVA